MIAKLSYTIKTLEADPKSAVFANQDPDNYKPGAGSQYEKKVVDNIM